MGWARESTFLDLLERNSRKLSKDGLDALTSIAVVDEFECYKHVAALLERQMRKGKDKQRVNVLHVLSHILRRSTKKHGQKDKYAKRLEGRLVEIGKLLGECPAEHGDKIQKVVDAWRRESIFGRDSLDALGHVLRQSLGAANTARPIPIRRSPQAKTTAKANASLRKPGAPTAPPVVEKLPQSPGSSAVESTAAPAGNGNEPYDPYRDATTGPTALLPASVPPVPTPLPVAPPAPPTSAHPHLLGAPPGLPPATPAVPGILPTPPHMCYAAENPYGYNQFYPPAPTPPAPVHHAPPVPPPAHLSVPPHLLNPGCAAPLPPSHPPPPPAPPTLYPTAQPPPPSLPPGVGPRQPYGFKPPPPPPPLLPPPVSHKDLPPGLGPLPTGQATAAAAAGGEPAVSSSNALAGKRSEEINNLDDLAPASKRARSSRWGPPTCSQGKHSKGDALGSQAKQDAEGTGLSSGQRRTDLSSSRQGPDLSNVGAGDGTQRGAARCDVNALIEKARGLAAALVRSERAGSKMPESNVRQGPVSKPPSLGCASGRPLPAACENVDEGGSADMSLGQSGEVAAQAALHTEFHGPECGAEEVTSTLKRFGGKGEGGRAAVETTHVADVSSAGGDLGPVLEQQPPLPMPPSSPPAPLPPLPPSPARQASCGGESVGAEAGGRSGQDSQSLSPQGGWPQVPQVATEGGALSAEGAAGQP